MSTIYPPETRFLNDYDCLVRPSEFAIAGEALQDHGFQRITHGKPGLPTLHEASFVKRLDGTSLGFLEVDVHRSIHSPRAPFRMDTEILLASVQQASPEPWISALCTEHTLINYGIQVLTDGYIPSFSRMADIYALANANIRWDKFCKDAIDARAAGTAYLALHLALMLGAEVPRSVMGRLSGAHRGARTGVALLAVHHRNVLASSDPSRSHGDVILDCFFCQGIFGRLYGFKKVVGRIVLANRDRRLSVLVNFARAVLAIVLILKWTLLRAFGLFIAKLSWRSGPPGSGG